MTAFPLPGGRQITAALTVKLGRQNRAGRWVEQPAAKYECLVCETSTVVIGAEKVTALVHTIRTSHPATCPGHPIEGAHAA